MGVGPVGESKVYSVYPFAGYPNPQEKKKIRKRIVPVEIKTSIFNAGHFYIFGTVNNLMTHRNFDYVLYSGAQRWYGHTQLQGELRFLGIAGCVFGFFLLFAFLKHAHSLRAHTSSHSIYGPIASQPLRYSEAHLNQVM